MLEEETFIWTSNDAALGINIQRLEWLTQVRVKHAQIVCIVIALNVSPALKLFLECTIKESVDGRQVVYSFVFVVGHRLPKLLAAACILLPRLRSLDCWGVIACCKRCKGKGLIRIIPRSENQDRVGGYLKAR